MENVSVQKVLLQVLNNMQCTAMTIENTKERIVLIGERRDDHTSIFHKFPPA